MSWTGLSLLLVWMMIHVGIFAVGFFKQKNDSSLDRLNKPVGVSIWVSRGSALILHFDAMIILLPVCRAFWSVIRNVSPYGKATRFLVDGQIDFHRHIGYSILIASFIHTCGHFVNLMTLQKLKMFDPYFIMFQHPAGITGIVLLLIQFVMFSAATSRNVRIAKYEIFLITHGLAIPWLLFVSVHGVGCFVHTSDGTCKGYETWRYIIPGLVLYLFDLGYRVLRRRKPAKITSIIHHPCDVVELRFVKSGMLCKPAQWVFICIPRISKFQYHPFTVTNCVEDGYYSLHVRAVGDWTQKLLQCDVHELVSQPIYVDGPYGAPAEHYCEYSQIVLIGAGIGVTPFVPILKNLWYVGLKA